MKVRFTRHAKERMSERGISQSDVLAVLRAPDRVYRDRDLWCAEKMGKGGLILRVYFRKADCQGQGCWLVITTFRSRRPGKPRR